MLFKLMLIAGLFYAAYATDVNCLGQESCKSCINGTFAGKVSRF